jgi:hypothetical protein
MIDILFKQTNSIHGKIKHIFPDDDLAIIEIDNPINDAEILEHKAINTRQSGDVFTIGFPLSSTNIKITKGIISGYQESLIQTDATLNHGNSGGPLVIFDESDSKYKVIGVNVSKLKGDAEKTGYVVPIYRFQILNKYIESNSDIIIKKPCLLFDFQKLTQIKLRKELFKNKIGEFNDKIGIRVSSTNLNYYHSTSICINDILLAVNEKPIDYNGYVKFDFYPEKISIDDIGLWFVPGDKIKIQLFYPSTLETNTVTFNLEIVKTNLLEFYNLPNSPKYFVENNSLILSVFTEQHFERIKDLELSIPKLVKLLERRLYHRDLFTVYLADIDFTKSDNSINLPVGEIIDEINGIKIESYEQFITITKNPINKIKTIENDVYFI